VLRYASPTQARDPAIRGWLAPCAITSTAVYTVSGVRTIKISGQIKAAATQQPVTADRLAKQAGISPASAGPKPSQSIFMPF
jgi:hypothetical protein